MQDEERLAPDLCTLCGSEISGSTATGYGYGAGNFLCAICAVARGGRYDAAREVWDRAPDLSDLPDEAYGASPHERESGRRHR